MTITAPQSDIVTEPGGDQSRDAWNTLIESLATFGAYAADFPRALDRAEGMRHTLRLLTHLAEQGIERQDPLRPEFFRPISHIRKFWGDAADVDYDTAAISPDEEYRVSGNRGTVPYLAALVNRTGYKGERVADNFLITEDMCDEDRNFEFFIARELGDRPGLRVDDYCTDVVVRQYHKLRDQEVDPTFTIERLGDPIQARTPLSEEWTARRLRMIAKGMENSRRRLHTMIENLSTRPNVIVATGEERGWSDFFGTSSNQYLAGWWDLSDCSSVEMTFTPPDCVYFGANLYNKWFESLEHRDHTSNLNDAQLKKDPDGRITIRIGGPADAPNRLDTCGHTEGLLIVRHLEPQGEVQLPTVRMIP